MLAPPTHVTFAWRSLAAPEPRIRVRVAEEVRGLAWTLSQMEALLHDAHRAAALEHAFLMPRIELRLPIYDVGRRYRIVLTYVEKPRIALVDEDDRKLADIILV